MNIYRTGSYVGPRPLQKLSFKDKVKDDYKWAKQCVDYFGSYDRSYNSVNRESLNTRLDWYNSKFKESDFSKILNPLGSSNRNYTRWAADLRPFNILRPIVDRIQSEYRKRPFGFTVDVNNADAVKNNEIQMMNEIVQSVRQLFINEVNNLSQSEELTGLPTQEEVPDPENIRERYANLRDLRAIEGSHALDFILSEVYGKQILDNGMLDWLIKGMIVTLKEVENEDFVYRKLNPEHCGWDSSVDFIENGEYAWSREYRPVSWIVEKFEDELTQQNIDDLEDWTRVGYNARRVTFNNVGGSNDVEILHTTWKSYTKIGILTYVDPQTGEILETEVSEDYKAGENEVIKWIWITEVWEGYRVANDIYLRIRPLPYQRRRMNQRGESKLPYNGRIYSTDRNNSISVVSLAIPYQMLYIIIMRQLELTLAKNKGKVLQIDKNAIPNEDGWDEEKFIYYIQALGYSFHNRNQIGVDRSYNQYSTLDLSTLNDVQALVQLAEWCKQHLKDHFGITPQREGQFSGKEGTGQREMDLFQSAIISEEIYARYDEFVERELQGMLDLSKFCWRNGKRARFTGSDQRDKILDIDIANYAAIDYGVKATMSPKSLDLIKRMQNTTHAFAQNNAAPSTILEILQADNVSQLKEAVNKMESIQQEQAERERQGNLEAIQAQSEAENQKIQLEHQQELEKIELEYQKKLEIEALKQSLTYTPPIEDQEDPNVVQANMKDKELKSKEDIERGKLNLKNNEIRAKLADNQAERANKRYIENLKSQTALKNKTVGEK